MTIGLLDISTVLHRIRHRKDNPELGETTLSIISKIKERLNLDRIVCIQDFGGSRFRVEAFPEYKAHRKEKELTKREEERLDELRVWNKNLELFNPFFLSGKIYGVEADDLIGILYWELKAQGYTPIAITVDKDFLSAIPYTSVFNWEKDRYCTLEDTYNLRRSKFLLYQALQGDATDNIKGVCGQKTALVLVDNFDSFKEMKEFNLTNTSDLVGITPYNKRYVLSALQKIKTEEGWNDLKLSYSLVKIFKSRNELNEEEACQYDKVLHNIKTWVQTNEITPELESFLWENNVPDLAYRLERLF